MIQGSGSKQGTPIYDTLQVQRQRFNSVQGIPNTSQSSKEAMQLLYKQQLDTFLEEKVKQKQIQRMREEEQKKQFNTRAQQGKEAQRMKQISYKNYYNMLMNNQNQNQGSYVSPFAKRDNLKDSLINKAIEDQRNRYQDVELEIRRREAEKRSSYKNDLLQQIEERKRRDENKKQNELKQKHQFQANTKVPTDIQRYQRQKHKDQINKYREDLDTILIGRQRSQSQKPQKEASLSSLRPEFHNILTNPIPYNIQNPYILKEMGVPKNPNSYLAMKGSQNLKQV